MRIKRVEIIGFKSFCDRAVVHVDASVIAVVGPNGCGKSNIVDAIRWCMGEQSAKHLRGKAMEDVIFAGSETRGPAPMAEVSLTLDDVGFSHETLEMALQSDEAAAERALDAIEPDPVDEAAEPDLDDVLETRGAPPPDFTRYTEVTITRRLFRDGVSQYFINKTPCRLRDITDFFLGTGVGTKAYSIIEQGRIGQIVSARPQDRRAIIEEAAGITKFKAKKKAAERKLEQTRQNLLRVSDIVSELDRRMGTLRRQAQKAERYRKYKAEMRDLELWRASHRYLELHGDEMLVGGRLGEARTERDDARAAFDVKDAHVVAERADLAVEERRLAAIQEALYDVDNRIRLAESKIGFERREADDLEARAVAADNELVELAAQHERARAELAESEAELAALTAEVAREDDDVAARDAAASDARGTLDRAQVDLERVRLQLAAARTDVATATAQHDAVASRRGEAEARRARLAVESDDVGGRSREVDRELRRVDGALSRARQTRLDLGVQQDGFVERAAVLAEEVGRGEAQVETLRTELHRRKSRLTSLIEIQERYEGFARGTRTVMQKLAAEVGTDDAGERPAWSLGGDQIRGLVADVVRAPEALEVAVEAALGDRLGGVLVADAAAGVRAIGYLKQASAGRSTFVPMLAMPEPEPVFVLDPVTEPEPDPDPAWAVALDDGWAPLDDEPSPSPSPSPSPFVYEDRSALTGALATCGGEGVIGRMSDLVELADGYAAMAPRLFGDCVVVDTLDRAVAMHDRGIAETLVTLDGDVVDPRGVVTGGSRDASGSGVLAQKREIRELEDIVASLEHDLSNASIALVTAKQELQRLTKAIEGLRGQVHSGDLEIIGHEKDHGRLRGEHDRMHGRLNQLAAEMLELDETVQRMLGDEASLRERIDGGGARIGVLDLEQTDLALAVATGRERVDILAAELTEARIRAAQLGEKRASVEARALRLARTQADVELRADRLRDEAVDGRARAAALRDGCAALAIDVEQLAEKRRVDATALDDGRTAYERRVVELTAVELAARELRSRADKLATEVGQLELRLGQIAMNRQLVVDQIAERHQIDLAKVLFDHHLRPVVGEVEEARLGELRDLIERMGTDINLTAIDEFAEVSTRFEFLSTQQKDLESAVDQLQRAIDKINRTSRRLFKDTFTAVNDTFKLVFPRLFRGGQANLSLSGDDDLLEAGIEIMAQPPGKKNTTVDQLSGGEKALTAVALIFSIFLIKPSPFCILDEVDAPLDEANVDRYNELVREMTDRSQFIVITHNKRTMESADNLYGVTMQEPGVSKLVTVNLSKLGATAA